MGGVLVHYLCILYEIASLPARFTKAEGGWDAVDMLLASSHSSEFLTVTPTFKFPSESFQILIANGGLNWCSWYGFGSWN